jgi:hypothetical protein
MGALCWKGTGEGWKHGMMMMWGEWWNGYLHKRSLETRREEHWGGLLSWRLPLQFLLLLLLLLSALRNRVDSNLSFLALTLGGIWKACGFWKIRRTWKILLIWKNQAEIKSLADFEKSGGHEKSCRFWKIRRTWKILWILKGGHEKSCGFWKIRRTWKVLRILKNQADMKNLADFEKSGGNEKSCGFWKFRRTWKILRILKNQADMKNLADFEKSGGHEKSCGFWKIRQTWKILRPPDLANGKSCRKGKKRKWELKFKRKGEHKQDE